MTPERLAFLRHARLAAIEALRDSEHRTILEKFTRRQRRFERRGARRFEIAHTRPGDGAAVRELIYIPGPVRGIRTIWVLHGAVGASDSPRRWTVHLWTRQLEALIRSGDQATWELRGL